MGSRRFDLGHISAGLGIVAALGGVAGFFFSPDSQRCLGLRGVYRGHLLRALRHCTDDTSGRAQDTALLSGRLTAPGHDGVASGATPTPSTAAAASMPPAGELSTAAHAALSPVTASPTPVVVPSPDPTTTSPGRFAGTHWVFYQGDVKTQVDFAGDGTVTFSDASWGADGLWRLVGKRDIAFHTDTYEFTGTPGRDVPDTFVVSYRHLPRSGDDSEPATSVTFVRVP